ncbi:hypothetical protein SAMN06265360_113125 [Haloechinothrix alba]|uniref:ACT domain-containing protein n=1 Tax=Haloechinothrix alba TaxID=664784 RepID=A0A238Y685_9PSEU|nr:hypothetical protein SAMN06265360_113125 [Haloechinothrix alba]
MTATTQHASTRYEHPHEAGAECDGGTVVESFGHTVTVADGFDGVNRIVGKLRSHRYRVTDFHAYPVSEPGTWAAEYTVAGTTDDARLLRGKLERIPSVIEVHSR